jgi:N-acetylmuramoyl-L-alanine amidase
MQYFLTLKIALFYKNLHLAKPMSKKIKGSQKSEVRTPNYQKLKFLNPPSLWLFSLGILGVISGTEVCVMAQSPSLVIAYPPENHKTTADSIFLIGSASPGEEVFINGELIKRSHQGHFAPSFPLKLGENKFTIKYQNEEITRVVTKTQLEPVFFSTLGFAENALTPNVNIARLPGELICFEAIAPINANEVSLELGNKEIALSPVSQLSKLPANSGVLIGDNTPIEQNSLRGEQLWQNLQGCTSFNEPGLVGNPMVRFNLDGKTLKQQSPGTVTILARDSLEVVRVIANNGIARTGPSTSYSRLTPLPNGTLASVTGKEGEWLRLDYGAWIKESETEKLETTIPPISLIRSVTSQELQGITEVIFPLQNPVPVSVKQGDQFLTVTLHNTIAQTDTIYFDDNRLVRRLDWEQETPTKVSYTFNLKFKQQWGYDLRYQGTSLILSLRHPPNLSSRSPKSLNGVSILLDPGHGGKELGSRGPNGYPEKDVNLIVSKLLQRELTQRGAKVYLTRETDLDVSLGDRVKMINDLEPTLAFSIHYNALPDGGDAINTQGVSTFWYHPQAHDLAVFLHNYVVNKLNRPSYGVFWNNLALTRPHTTPTVLLELGFMINPDEFEWITNSVEQEKLATAIADGITAWLTNNLKPET